jgi:hypothetical protein
MDPSFRRQVVVSLGRSKGDTSRIAGRLVFIKEDVMEWIPLGIICLLFVVGMWAIYHHHVQDDKKPKTYSAGEIIHLGPPTTCDLSILVDRKQYKFQAELNPRLRYMRTFWDWGKQGHPINVRVMQWGVCNPDGSPADEPIFIPARAKEVSHGKDDSLHRQEDAIRKAQG